MVLLSAQLATAQVALTFRHVCRTRSRRLGMGGIDVALPALRKNREWDVVDDCSSYVDYGDCQGQGQQHCHSRLDGFPARHRSHQGMSWHDVTRDFFQGLSFGDELSLR